MRVVGITLVVMVLVGFLVWRGSVQPETAASDVRSENPLDRFVAPAKPAKPALPRAPKPEVTAEADSADAEDTESADVVAPSDAILDAHRDWAREKIGFYREDLDLTEAEIASIERLKVEKEAEIMELLAAYRRELELHPPKPNAEYDPEKPGFMRLGTDRIYGKYQWRVLNLLGPERYNRVLAFRDEFNARVEHRDGINPRVGEF